MDCTFACDTCFNTYIYTSSPSFNESWTFDETPFFSVTEFVLSISYVNEYIFSQYIIQINNRSVFAIFYTSRWGHANIGTSSFTRNRIFLHSKSIVYCPESQRFLCFRSRFKATTLTFRKYILMCLKYFERNILAARP